MRNTSADIVVVGGANTDYLVQGSRLPKLGETLRGDHFVIAPGGKGVNQAIAVARLGGHVALVARVGNDARGYEHIAKLTEEGVDVSWVTRDPEVATGIALIMVGQRGEKQILTAAGANHDLKAAHVRAARPAIETAKVLMIPLDANIESALEAARLGHAAKATVILDPSPPDSIPDELYRLADIIKPDTFEAGELTGISVRDRASARAAADKLLKRGVRAVSIQAGNEGNLLVWQGGEHFLPWFPVKSVDATGAGDTFAAALAVALVEGRPLNEADVFASAAAAVKTTMLGAQAGLPHRAAVDAFLAQHRGQGAASR